MYSIIRIVRESPSKKLHIGGEKCFTNCFCTDRHLFYNFKINKKIRFSDYRIIETYPKAVC